MGGTRGNAGETTSEGGTSNNNDAGTIEGEKHISGKQGRSEDVLCNKYKYIQGDNTVNDTRRRNKQQQPHSNRLTEIRQGDHVESIKRTLQCTKV